MRKNVRFIGFVAVLLTVFLSGCVLFGGKKEAYNVAGTILDEDGKGVANVAINFSGDFGVAETDEEGKWSKAELTGTVTVTPVQDGFKFEPTSREVTKEDLEVDFTAIPAGYFLTVNVIGNGKVVQEELAAITSVGEYEDGAVVQLTAEADSGFAFSHWEGDLEGSENPAEVTMDSSKTVTAVFVADLDPDNVTLEDLVENVWGYEPIAFNLERTAELYATSDSEYFYIWAIGELVNTNNNLLFDTDMDASTGYDGWQWADMGADIRITNDGFFLSTGRGWSFDRQEEKVDYVPFAGEEYLKGFFTRVRRERFGDIDEMRIGFGGSGGSEFSVIMPIRGGSAYVFTFE